MFRKVIVLIYKRDIDKHICTELMALTVFQVIFKNGPQTPLDPKPDFSRFTPN